MARGASAGFLCITSRYTSAQLKSVVAGVAGLVASIGNGTATTAVFLQRQLSVQNEHRPAVESYSSLAGIKMPSTWLFLRFAVGEEKNLTGAHGMH